VSGPVLLLHWPLKAGLIILYLTGLVGIFGAGCAGWRAPDTVMVGGSDVMVILARRWAREYMDLYPGSQIRVKGGGTEGGIAGLIRGEMDICMASRSLRPEETAAVKARRGVDAIGISVALDGVVVYVNGENKVSRMTLAQLKAIFTGRYSDWNKCGGKKGGIVLYGPSQGSGTWEYFREHVLLDGNFDKGINALPGAAAVVDAVEADPNGIGFGGMAYSRTARALGIRGKRGSAYVLPEPKTIASGRYPLSRELFFYTAGELEGATAKFIEWVLSPAGRKICQEAGYCPSGLGRR
jgi:phosphate transport system substrate-binding protein